jgi:hypothetical protein
VDWKLIFSNTATPETTNSNTNETTATATEGDN